MKKATIITAALAAMMAVPVQAQDEAPVVISGSLINWYYYGKDYTGSTSGEGWHQQSTGGGAWIDDEGVAHSTGASNYGLASLYALPGNSTTEAGLPTVLWAGFPIRNHILYSNCGGLWMGGNEYYSFFGHEVDASMNIDGEYGSEEYEILVRKWTWDGVDDDGNYTNVKYQQVGKMYNQATDFAYDPNNDIVYGVFNIGGADGYKLGTLDMSTFKITWISREAMPLNGELRTLACNSKGELFGTDKSGNIYRVSTTDGTLTTIGHMGFQSQQMMMSATFDYRTDKMYWIGFLNNGKKSASTDGTNNTRTVAEGGRDTGIYEIDVENGTATLIATTDCEPSYSIVNGKPVLYWNGKLQMTGIYVEGSIVKPDYDLKVTLNSNDQQLNVGETTTVTATVKNIGLQTVQGRKYSVSLYADGQLVDIIDYEREDVFTENLKAGQSKAYTFTYTAPAKAGNHILRVVIDFADDERLQNNEAETVLRVLSGELLPAPVLSGTTTSNGITLAWADPKGKIVDGAEDYVPFSYDNLGAWIMYDGDQGYTQKANNWNASIEYANWSTPKAFIVMDPVKAGFDLAVGGEKFMPHSGDQYFAAWWTAVPDATEAGGRQIPNNDWMISPALSGAAQTVSFWGKGYKGIEAEGYITEMDYPELMRVLATEAEYNSANDMDLADWAVVRDTFLVDNTAWTEYTAELPAGTKHFALQCCSQEGFVLMIDDISFAIEAKTVTGYNVYRNGELVATLPAGTTTWTDGTPAENAIYTVTAIYEQGESLPSNAVEGTGEIDTKPGDVNGDSTVDVADIANVISIMASGGNGGDVNGDGVTDVADIATIISIMAQ